MNFTEAPVESHMENNIFTKDFLFRSLPWTVGRRGRSDSSSAGQAIFRIQLRTGRHRFVGATTIGPITSPHLTTSHHTAPHDLEFLECLLGQLRVDVLLLGRLRVDVVEVRLRLDWESWANYAKTQNTWNCVQTTCLSIVMEFRLFSVTKFLLNRVEQ